MIQKEEFKLTNPEGKPIIGDLTYDDSYNNLSTIIFVHGFKGFKDWGAHHLSADFFAKKGFRYVKFNLSYSGVTEKQPNDVTDLEIFAANTTSKEFADLDTVISYAEQQWASPQTILIGHSKGGGVSIIQAANDFRIDKLVTWSAIADFSSLWKPEQEDEWRESGQIFVENARTKERMPLNSTLLEDFESNKDKFNILNAAQRVKIPWLIIHGDEDVNVPFSVAQELAQKQLRAQIQKIEGANHVYGASHPYQEERMPPQLQQVCEKTLAFLEQ